MLGFKFDKNGPYIEKDPNAVKNYSIDFAAEGDSFLIGGDTLATVDWNVPAPLVKTNEGKTATVATVWLSGGVSGASYTVTCHFTTVDGITDDRSFRVVIKEQ